MMKPAIELVGFAGKAGSGKNYLADVLEAELASRYGVSATQRSFAYEVRREIEDALGVEAPKLWEKPTSEPIRRLLQYWGTDYRRAQDPDHWVNLGMQSADNSFLVGHKVVMFTDLRFQNEAEAMWDRGGLVVIVHADESTRVSRIGLTPHHASEVLRLDAPDYGHFFHIDNSDNQHAELPVQIDRLVAKVMGE